MLMKLTPVRFAFRFVFQINNKEQIFVTLFLKCYFLLANNITNSVVEFVIKVLQKFSN